jgi:hypothetical protein
MTATSSDYKPITSKHHISSKFIALAVVCLLLAGILMYAIFSTSRGKWHCSASRPRPSGIKAWETATGPAQPPDEPNEDFFADFTISSNNEKFIVEFPTSHPPENPFAYEIRKMTPGEPLNIGGGTITLCALGTAYLDANQTMEDDAAYRFYDADLQSMTKEQVEKLGVYELAEPARHFRYRPYPSAKFGFRHEEIEDLMFQGIRVFDATTKKELTGGYSSGGRPGAYHWFTTGIPLWHRAPVDIVIEVSYGPSKIFEFTPRAGEGFGEDNFECRLVSVFEGADTYSSSSSSRDRTMIHEFRKAQPDKAGLRFVFACYPSAMKMPVTFDFLDADGNLLRGRGSSTSGFVHHRAIQQPPEKVASIRACYRTQRQRILIRLPYIPGLPEQNKNIDDLFDVYIPYVRLPGASQVGSFLQRTLQLQGASRTGPVPPESIYSIRFPVEFSDATLREIAQLYAQGGKLKVNIENDQLRLEYPLPLMTKLKQFLQQMFGRN